MATKRVSEKKVVLSTGAAAVPARRKSARTTRPASAVEVSGTPEVVAAEPVVEVEFTTEAVAQLAYSYWVARGYQGGSPEEDWLRAEQELRAATATK